MSQLTESNQTKVIEIQRKVELPELYFYRDLDIPKHVMEYNFINSLSEQKYVEIPNELIKTFKIPDKVWETWSPDISDSTLKSFHYTSESILNNKDRFEEHLRFGELHMDELSRQDIVTLSKTTLSQLIKHMVSYQKYVDKEKYKDYCKVIELYLEWKRSLNEEIIKGTPQTIGIGV